MPILLVILLIFGSCATPNTKPPELSSSEVTKEIIHQLEGTFRLTMQRQERIELLALPIMRANAALCGKKTRSLFGFDYLDSANTWEMEPRVSPLILAPLWHRKVAWTTDSHFTCSGLPSRAL